jgi:hypothetical protein
MVDQNVKAASAEAEAEIKQPKDYSNLFGRDSKKGGTDSAKAGEKATNNAGSAQDDGDAEGDAATDANKKASGDGDEAQVQTEAKTAKEGTTPAKELTFDEAKAKLKEYEDDRAIAKGDVAALANANEKLLAALEEQGFDLDDFAQKANVSLKDLKRVKATNSGNPADTANPAMEKAVKFDEAYYGKPVLDENGKLKVDDKGLPIRKGGIKNLLDKAEGTDTGAYAETFAALVALDPQIRSKWVKLDDDQLADFVVEHGKKAIQKFGDLSLHKGGLLGALERSQREITELKAKLAGQGSDDEADGKGKSVDDESDDKSGAANEPQKGKRPSLSSARGGNEPNPVDKAKRLNGLFAGR